MSKDKIIERLNGVSPMEDISQDTANIEHRRLALIDVIRAGVSELAVDDAQIIDYSVVDETYVSVKVSVGNVARALTREGILMSGRVGVEKKE